MVNKIDSVLCVVKVPVAFCVIIFGYSVFEGDKV